MHFELSDEQKELVTRIREFAAAKLNGQVAERCREGRFAAEEWKAAGEFGLLGLCVPTSLGGMGLNTLDTALSIEAFGTGCEDMGLMFAASAHLFACVEPLVAFASEPLKIAVVPRLARGELIGANAITEAEAGSDVFAMRTRAEKVAGGYRLNGLKSYVTNGPVADVFLVYASTQPKLGYLGMSAFLVDRQSPGLNVGKPFEKIGLTTALTSSVYFEDCFVSEERRVGAEGQGALAFTQSMHWERACLFAGYLGMMERQLAAVLAHARSRTQFGRAIGKNQAVSHRIANMKARLESARLLLYRACWERDQGRTATLEVSLAKLAISEAAVASSLDAVQLFGGMGVMEELPVARMLRDSLPSTVFSGTSEMQRELIARELGL